MLIVFASNFLNHHQLPLAMAFYNMENVEYHFLAFEPTSINRIKLGYEEMNGKYEFVLKAYESDENYNKAIKLIKKADIFISGQSDEHIKIRLKEGKRSYKFSERYYKTYDRKGFKYSNLHFFLSSLKHVLPFNNKDVIYLAASSYLKNDLNRFYKCKNTILKWGYLPEHIERNEIVKPSNKDLTIRILFVGRFISWKNPEMCINALKSLPKNIFEKVQLTYVGDGELLPFLKNLVKENKLERNVIFKGSMNNKEVRNEMLSSDIFVFPSNFSEGWGAVLNEAMDSGCACIASKEAGSSNFLINDGENGLLFSCFSQDELNAKLLNLINNKELREKLQNNAYLTIKNRWNADVAAKRLIEFHNGHSYEEGICSKA